MPKFKRTRVVEIFESLGFNGADNWNAGRLHNRVLGLSKSMTDESLGDDDLDRLVQELVQCVKDGDEIESVDDENESDVSMEPEVKVKATKSKSKKPKKAVEYEDVMDEDDEQQNDAKTEPKKTAAKAKSTQKKRDKPSNKSSKPGVISSIIEILQGCTSKKTSMSIDDVTNELTRRFPDRSSTSMRSTAYTQIKYRLPKNGLPVKESDGKFWIAK